MPQVQYLPQDLGPTDQISESVEILSTQGKQHVGFERMEGTQVTEGALLLSILPHILSLVARNWRRVPLLLSKSSCVHNSVLLALFVIACTQWKRSG